MKKLIHRHSILKILLLALLIVFFIIHFLTMLGVIPYENLWGTAVSGSGGQFGGELIAVVLIFLFLLSVFFENHPSTTLRSLSNFGLIIGAVYMLLNFFGYLRCDSIALKILMGLFTLIATIVTVLLLITQYFINVKTAKQKHKRSHQAPQ